MPVGHLQLFGVLLALSLGFQLLVSPRRRRLLGPVKFTLAAAIEFGIPMFGVIVLRAGWRHAYLDAGRGWWTALWLSLFWMVLFLIVARAAASLIPPFSWLMRDWRKAKVQGFKMMFGFGGGPVGQAGPGFEAPPSEPRFVGRSSIAGSAGVDRRR